MSTSDSEPAILDERMLMETAGDSIEEATNLAGMFHSLTSAAFADMRTAVARGDFDEVRRLAHRTAGSAAACGLMRLATALRTLELQGIGDGNANHLDRAEREFERASAALSEFVSREGHS